jgi:rare lipoprotein A (peptidoglycan hydrolase)
VNARRHGCRARHALLALVGAALLLPAGALAATPRTATGDATANSRSATSGGGGLTGGASPVDAPTTVPTSGHTPVSTSGNGLTLATISSSLLRHRLAFSGTATAAAGQQIEIERDGRQTDWVWQPVATATVNADGSFDANWKTNQAGRFAIRAVVAPSDLAAAADATQSLTVTVYRQSKATFYGPGFYGHQTACGTRLTKTTIGVANRTLRCGATVSLLFKGETLSVPVIDRGPYANGANWDLTMATAQALGMDGTARIGAVALPKVPAAARRAARVRR